MRPIQPVVWYVEEVCWDEQRLKGEITSLLIEARTCSEAAILAGEGDGVNEIKRIVNLGPIVARTEKRKGKK